MARTVLGGAQIKDGSVQREDVDVSTVGKSLITRVLNADGDTSLSITSDGADAGTGVVKIALSSALSSNIPRLDAANSFTASPNIFTGSVGIGDTAAPTATLTVRNNSTATTTGQEVLRLRAQVTSATIGSGPRINFASAANTVVFGSIAGSLEASTASGFAFYTYNSSLAERMHLYGSGGLYLGTSPSDPGAGVLSVGGTTLSSSTLQFLAGSRDIRWGGSNTRILSANSGAEGAGNFNFQFGGNTVALLSAVASGKNYLELRTATVGNGPILITGGDDTNVDLNISTKGTGIVKVNTALQVSGGVKIQQSGKNTTFFTNIAQQNYSTIPNGFVKFVTPIRTSHNQMFSIDIEGYDYQAGETIDFTVAGYAYASSDSVINLAYSNRSSFNKDVRVALEDRGDGYRVLVIALGSSDGLGTSAQAWYYQKFAATVRVWSGSHASYAVEQFTWATETTLATGFWQSGNLNNLNMDAENGTINAAGLITAGRFSGSYISHTSLGSPTTLARTVFGLADYRANLNPTGALVFIAPAGTSSIMHYLEVHGFLYSSAQSVRLTVQGYRTTGSWSAMMKTSTGTFDVAARWGVTPDGKNCLILGDVSTTWSYPFFSIVVAKFSHTGASDAYCSGWTVATETDLSAYTNVSAFITNSASVTSITGSAASATTASSANALVTGRTIGMTGDVAWTSASFTGAGNVTGTSTIQAGAVTLAKMANLETASFIGRNTAGTGVPEALSTTTARSMLSINNVENTALSTWAGTSNISQVAASLAFGASGPRWKNSSGTLQARNNADNANASISVEDVTAAGTVTSGGIVSAGTHLYAASRIGRSGRGGLTLPADGVITLIDNAATSFNRLQFGGTTSNYPSLKRSGITLQVRLADDSADASISASDITASGTFTGNGSGLTALNASNISSGAMSIARLSDLSFGSGLEYKAGSLAVTPPPLSIPIALTRSVDQRIAGKTPTGTINLFSSMDHVTGSYVRNVNAAFAEVDTTCAAVWNQTEGNGRFGPTAIGKRIVIFANHAAINTGHQIRFVTRDNITVTATIADQRNAGGDIQIALLTQDLPETIGFAQILPPDIADYCEVIGLPVIGIDQEKKTRIADLTEDVAGGRRIDQSSDPTRALFYELADNGDSGTPVLLVNDRQLILTFVHTTNYTGSRIEDYISAINTAIGDMGGTETLTVFDAASLKIPYQQIEGASQLPFAAYVNETNTFTQPQIINAANALTINGVIWRADRPGTANPGLINTSAGVNPGVSGGSISTAGSGSALFSGMGGSINTGGSVGHGGAISTFGGFGAGGNGGAITTNGASGNNGGAIDTKGGAAGAGGSIYTSNGGGSIDTRGVGSLELGVAATRTTFVGSATAARTITLPDETGTVLTTASPLLSSFAQLGLSNVFTAAQTINAVDALTINGVVWKADKPNTWNPGAINTSAGTGNNAAGGTVNTSGGSGAGASGGSISTYGGVTGNGGSINTAGGSYAGGYINTSGPSGVGGYINTSGGFGAGGSPGGFIDTRAGVGGAGGSLDLANGGGSINTRGVGSIGLGVASTRTTLVGSATAARTITLPDTTGTLVTTNSAGQMHVIDDYTFSSAGANRSVNIPSGYTNLRIVISAIAATGTATDIFGACNSDNSNGNYFRMYTLNGGGGNWVTQPGLEVGVASTSSTTIFSTNECTIPLHSSTTSSKVSYLHSWYVDNNTNYIQNTWTRWTASTNAITNINFVLGTGANFAVGSRIIVYGIV